MNRSDSFTGTEADAWAMRQAVAGLFHDHDRADDAIRALHDAGFDRAGIGVADRDRDTQSGLLEALIGMDIPDEEARHFESGFREGAVLVTIRAPGRAVEARALLDHFGADLGPAAVPLAPARGAQGGKHTGAHAAIRGRSGAAGAWSGELDRRRSSTSGRRRTDRLDLPRF